MNNSVFSKKNTLDVLFWLVLLLGAAVRIWRNSALPGDINQDEAFAGYTAYSLLKYGIDTSGYHFPVYLVAWGSGMNALNSYLMIPFIALFGLKTWVIRLPQLIIAILSLPAAYGLIKRLFNERTAFFTLLILAFCPWHIMLSRWGLESNLAPGFLLFGLYFFIRSFDDRRFLPISAIMYGLSLYTYATIWPFVPFIILFQGLYSIARGKLKADAVLLACVIILGLFALPLLLFLLVNYGLIPEIRLSFISIPKLLYMRSGELSLSHIPENFRTLLKLLVLQNDGLPWNSTHFGLIYHFSLPVCIAGIICLLYRTFKASKEFKPEIIILIQLLAGLILGLMIDVNVNRANIIFIPLIICTSVGLDFICEKLSGHLFTLILALYLGAFCVFSVFYFKEYQSSISYYFAEGLEESVKDIKDFDGTVYVYGRIYYPSLLFYTGENVNRFLDSVEYKHFPAAYLSAKQFDKYVFFDEIPQIDKNAAYILPSSADITEFEALEFEITYHKWFITAK